MLITEIRIGIEEAIQDIKTAEIPSNRQSVVDAKNQLVSSMENFKDQIDKAYGRPDPTW